MKKKVWIWIGVSIIIIAALIFIIMRFVGNSPEIGEEFEEVTTVQKVSERTLGETILVTGKIVPEDEQKVFADAESGEIKQFVVEENAVVKAGDPLFHYDTTKISSEYNRAVRERDLTQQRLKIEQKQSKELATQIANMKKYISAESDYTKEDISALEKEKVQIDMEVESTKAEITAAQESINEISEQRKKLSPVSKIDGIVVKINKNIDVTDTNTSEPVVHIISNEPFKVIGTMSEFDAVKIKPEQKVTIMPKVFKDREWNGVVESVSQFPEGEQGGDEFGGGGSGNVTMYPFKVAITDDTSELRQGFHVTLEIDLSDGSKSIAVPHSALLTDFDEEGEETQFVFIMKDGILEKRIVQVGDMSDEFMAITEGLAVDELIVINPHFGLEDGMEVEVYDEVE